jgi:hypothetical protein
LRPHYRKQKSDGYKHKNELNAADNEPLSLAVFDQAFGRHASCSNFAKAIDSTTISSDVAPMAGCLA